MPFLVLIPLSFIFSKLNRVFKSIIVLALFISFLSAIPFIEGNIQTVYSAAHKKGQNYLTAENSSLVKIPSEYSEAANRLNQEKLLNRIVSGPYNVINSVGWVNFPKWKLIGVDPTIQLFDKPISQMNAFSVFDNWNYGQLWNRQNPEESAWLLPFFGLLGDRYFIYHTDADPKFIEQTSDKIKSYLAKGYFTQIEKNDYFTLYKLSDQFYLPHIYTPKEIKVVNLLIPDLPAVIDRELNDNRQALYFTKGKDLGNLTKNMPAKVESPPTVEYRKINPTKFRVRVHQAKETFPLIFSQAYSDSWRLYSEDSKKLAGTDSSLDNYQQITGNASDQATKAELSDFINHGLVSDISKDNKNLAFISKNIKDTIQNDNLPNGSIFETWFKKPLSSEYAHIPVNGYANSWLINPEKFCAENSCTINPDGSFDFELVMEFWPQRLYYIFGFVTLLTLITSIIFIIRNIIFKKGND